MKTIFVIPVLLCSLAVFLCQCFRSPQTVHGSGNRKQEVRHVADFNKINLSGSGVLILSQGKKEALTIEIDDNVLPYIVSEVANNDLQLKPKDSTQIHTNEPIKYLNTFKVKK